MTRNHPILFNHDLNQQEYETLAPYAMLSAASRGRDYPLPPDKWRTDFQRDRDRIIHSAAFRKLEYKTQVYMVHFGDYYRTRLTHTMEVAQIARSLARNLRLNTDLAEAIALAHDVGHAPFGHSGETALKRILAGYGGFEHNEQGLRVVEILEERYPHFPGLNLTFEVREGIIKHSSEYDKPNIPDRFSPGLSSTLESQICDVADEIAYNSHDIDDSLKMNLIHENQLSDVDWVWDIFKESRFPNTGDDSEKYVKFKSIGKMIEMMVADVVETSAANIEKYRIDRLEKVRHCPSRIVGFSTDMQEKNRRLKDFLMANVYRHPSVVRMNSKAEGFIERLFELYVRVPGQLPLKYQRRIETEGIHRVVTDYISGMTDSFLQEDYIRAFEPTSIHY